jgi:hypothetical protein
MQLSIFKTSPSVAAPAEKRSEAGKAGENELPSARIRRARELVGDVLLEDEERLLGLVSERLNSMMLELDTLAGRQKLFELWISQ